MRRLISLAILLGSVAFAAGQTAPAAQTATAANGVIHGTVISGAVGKPGSIPLPGVSVTATDAASGKTYSTTTDINGAYAIKVPVGAKYEVATDLAGFAAGTQEITLSSPDQLSDFGIQLASRAEAQQEAQQAANKAAADRATEAAKTPSLADEARRAAGQTPTANQTAQNRPGGARTRQVIRQGARPAAGARGAAGSQTQTLETENGLDPSDTAASTPAETVGTEGAGNADTSGMQDVASESIVSNGAIGQVNGLAGFSQDDIEQRMAAMRAQGGGQGGGFGGDNAAMAGMLGGLMQGGPGGGPGGGRGGGGPGGGAGGRGGRGGGGGPGGGGGGGFGGFRQFNQNQIHGNVGYTGSNSGLNAQPWSPDGIARQVPQNSRNSLTASVTGSPYLPGLTKPNLRQSVFLNLALGHNTTPAVNLATVPTIAQRAGDFSGLTQNIKGTAVPVTLYDPTTGTPIPNNDLTKATTPRSDAALKLLKYYPASNIATTSTGYNYQTLTTNAQHSETGSLRYTRNFGAQVGGGGRGRAGGGGAGARGAAGGRQNQNVPKVLTQNISFSGSYSHSASDSHPVFLALGGNSETSGYNFSFGHTLSYGRIRNNLTLTFNRSNSTNVNYFTHGASNPTVDAGILFHDPNGIIQNNPFNYGLPGLSFSNGFTGMSDQQPSQSIGQTISFSDFMSWRWKQHNLRWGGDIRRVHSDATGGGNVLGRFTFTGYATQNPSAGECTVGSTGCPPTGNSFADFLFGLPQTSAIQASQFKTYMRQWVYDWYLDDDWRLANNLTLTLGLRYEYFSPLTEKNNHLVNLDHSADFSKIAVVLPGQTGSVTGTAYPNSLVKPDRGLYSPRVAFAYRLPKIKNAVLRGSYGINYTTNQYASFAHNLAFQQPYAFTQTNSAATPTVTGTAGCTMANLTLEHGFNCSTVPVQNSYAVNPFYRLGWLQIWNLTLQKTLPMGIVLNIGYNGSHGGDQDMIRVPNRTATSLLNPSASVFNYEDSLGFSRFNSMVVGVNKRLQKGIAVGATYQWGHSIDNASALGGGGGGTVAQDDANLAAEESNSSFDVRQRLSGTFLLELPFGPGRAFLNKGGVMARILDGWGLSGNYSFATGGYSTPTYQLTVSEAATGANGLRPNRDFSQPINGPHTLKQWFNTGAFTSPASGTFGNASRNSIQRPGTVGVNATLSRMFLLGDTRSLMFQLQASNALNIVQYSGIDTTLNDPKFGQVTSAAGMRSIVYTARYRF